MGRASIERRFDLARCQLLSGEEPSMVTAESWRRTMPTPSKKELSQAGKDLRNPRTSEKRETEASKTLRQGQKPKK
jgi:hypothetical protein